MAELFEPAETPEQPAPAVQTDGTAVAIALDRARRRKRGVAAPDEVDRFLVSQEALIQDQRAHLHEQMAHMRLKHFDQRLTVLLKLLTAAAGVAVAIGLVWMAIDASHADGLVVRPFSVPPSLAQRGLTGETVAAELIDRWGTMAASVQSQEQQRSVSAAANDGPSIEIPETGVSIAQVEQWLKAKLGHERRISGEVTMQSDGTLALNVRDGALAMPEQTGAEKDLPAMLQKAAESLFQREQPVSYGQFLGRNGRTEENLAHANWEIEQGDRSLKSIGYASRAGMETDLEQVIADYDRARAVDPMGASTAYTNLAGIEASLGHMQRAYELRQQALALFKNPKAFTNLSQAAKHQRVISQTMDLAGAAGDFNQFLASATDMSGQTLLGFVPNSDFAYTRASGFANLHDVAGARDVISGLHPKDGQAPANSLFARAITEEKAGDWVQALTYLDQLGGSRPRSSPGIGPRSNR